MYSIRLEAWWAMSGAPEADFPLRDPRGQLMHELRRQLGRWEAAAPTEEAAVFSSGATAIDRLLPGGGLRYGMLVEWLSERGGSGAATLGLLTAREACRSGGTLVVIDRAQTFYPLAAAAWGIDLKRMIVVHPRSARDELWAAVQALCSPAVAAMWAAIDRLESRAFRRLQLAAQAGRTLGLLLRPARVRGQPSWADVQLWVGRKRGQNYFSRLEMNRSLFSEGKIGLTPFSGVQVRVLRSRGGRPGGAATLEIDDAAHTVREVISQHEAHPLPVVTELAAPTAGSVSARA